MLTESEIKKFISDDMASVRKRLAGVGQRYYEGEHDILKHRLFYFNADGNLVEDTARSNVKISHPFFTELTEQISAYMLSFDKNPIRAKETSEETTSELQEQLDLYFDDDFWAEIGDLICDTYSKGFGYIYGYKDENDKLVFECADSMGIVEVRENDTDSKSKHIIYYYTDRIEKGKKIIKRIQVWDKEQVYFYVQNGTHSKIELDKDVEVNPRPHVVFTDEKSNQKMGYPLGYIPFWRLDNNKKQISGLKPIKSLIDDYDMMMCGLSNNLADFDTPLHVVKGFQGDNLDELQQNLKTKKIIGTDENGGVEVNTIDIPYEARKTKAEIDEKNIYRFGMGLNTNGLRDTSSATTNIAIKAAYSLLDMKANKLEKRLKRLLKDIVEVVLDEINEEQKTGYSVSDIYFDFDRALLTNESENIQNKKIEAETKQIRITTILNIAVNVGDEQTLKAICEEMEWDFETLKKQVEQMKSTGTADARQILDAVNLESDDDVNE